MGSSFVGVRQSRLGFTLHCLRSARLFLWSCAGVPRTCALGPPPPISTLSTTYIYSVCEPKHLKNQVFYPYQSTLYNVLLNRYNFIRLHYFLIIIISTIHIFIKYNILIRMIYAVECRIHSIRDIVMWEPGSIIQNKEYRIQDLQSTGYRI